MRPRPIAGLGATVLTMALAVALTGLAVAPPASASAGSPPAPGGSTTVALPNGDKVTYDTHGNGTLTSADGTTTRPYPVSPVSGHTAFGDIGQPDAAGVARAAAAATRKPYVSDQLVVGLAGTAATGASIPGARTEFGVPAARTAVTSNPAVNAALGKVHADALWPAMGTAPAPAGAPPTDVAGTYVVHLTGVDANTAAKELSGTNGIAFAEPDAFVSTMNSGGQPLPSWVSGSVSQAGSAHPAQLAAPASSAPTGVPANAGVTSSLQSYLNTNGVDALGAFADDASLLHQLPGSGEIVTNVSLGDLTDAGMAAAGDPYVRNYGPDSVIRDGQRYLDFPSLPLIPAYTADDAGNLDPTGSVEGVDPRLDEVLLDFSMMAPLPHDQQRPGAQGSAETDLLGIAPGARYRLVVPQQETESNIASAFLAAADQTPKPDVITASIGFGTDSIGYPGRYLEDDPLMNSVIDQVVRKGIVVVISANDGTRLGLPVAIGPDGGSTPTEVATPGARTTNIADDQLSTTPTVVTDSGAIDVGSTTTDDTLASGASSVGAYPETRYDGGADFSSGFGSRVDLAAPGDNLPALMHLCDGTCASPSDVTIELNGGTSASAPEVAAAAADVLQAAKATGRSLTPAQVRDVLERTGRPLTQTPQTDQPLRMGTQLDVTAAVESVLATKFPLPTTAVRMSVAQRQEIGSLGASFVEETDPNAIDLSGPLDQLNRPSGQDETAPITFGLDLTGAHQPGSQALRYRLLVGTHGVIPAAGPSVRVTPAQLFAAAGEPLVSPDSHTFSVTFQAYRGAEVVASATRSLTFGADDGTSEEALAPTAPGSVPLGQPVSVSYDLTGVRNLSSPKLVLSSVGHWTPNGGGDFFRAQYSVPLTATRGTVTIPASAFDTGGAGIYGVGIEQATAYGGIGIYGQFRAIRVGPDAGQRPAAPTLAVPGAPAGHAAVVLHSAPAVTLGWDARNVAGATGAAIEISSPAPTLYGSMNTFTNPDGSGRDDNGVDHPSTLYQALPGGAAGSTTLDLVQLGLPDSLEYSVRIVPTRAGRPIGQASPSSFLEFDDGATVASGQVQNFTLARGTAYLSTAQFGPGTDALIALDDTQVERYDTATGQLGGALGDSTAGHQMDDVVGTDPALNRTLVATVPFDTFDGPSVEEFDSTTGAPVATVKFPVTGTDPLYFDSGKIDPQRHRAALVTYEPVRGISQEWTFDLRTGQLSAPLTLNDSKIMNRAFYGLDIDSATGDVFVATTGAMGPCLSGRVGSALVRVDPTAGTVSPSVSLPNCSSGVLADGTGTNVDVLFGAVEPDPESGNFPTGQWRVAGQQTLQVGTGTDTGARGPMWPVLDGTHGIAVVAHLYEQNTGSDNNAMSELDTVDPATGKILSRSAMVNLVNSTVSTQNFEFTANAGIQLDPATRTAWVVDPYADGLERLHY